MMCEIDPTYKKKIVRTKDGNRKFLFGKLNKAVCGTLLGTIIFYKKLSKHLHNHEFKMNQYDSCTFNKMVNGEQLTVQIYVDDLKASHKEQAVLDDFMSKLREEFGKEDNIEETRGDLHDYLGFTIDYSLPSKVVFTMCDYLEDIIVKAPNDLKIVEMGNIQQIIDCSS